MLFLSVTIIRSYRLRNRYELSFGSKSIVSQYESNKRAITIDALLEYSNRFNVTTDWILKGVLAPAFVELGELYKALGYEEVIEVYSRIKDSQMQQVALAQLRAVFPLARIEEYQDAGACAVRKDICIDEFDIAIELKCTRESLSAKRLSEEVASDIVHYDNKNIFFLIYDKARIIDNIDVFSDNRLQNVATKADIDTKCIERIIHIDVLPNEWYSIYVSTFVKIGGGERCLSLM